MKQKGVIRKFNKHCSELKEILKEWLFLKELTKEDCEIDKINICKRLSIFIFI